ncbi:DUF2255 family protein [Paractinoplanes atraurantiacus]|uniref:DUF2255 family protein n=1 Tax=Paractinoplanes atraurantiacus TaxID=1036182 RepID=A0A285J035_9ACTN|nr:DUF2255 family protein [Actinoplanes atraurantiacus]SNY53665.1 hypothetical protein SAMN05421748_114125 [Actinoplanes atraurantiacus]
MSTALHAHLRDTDTVTVQTVAADGSVHRTPIWAVDVVGISYIRSSHGPSAAWYRRAVGPEGLAVIVDGRPVRVTLTPVKNEQVLDDVDSAYRTKYADQPRFVRNLVSRTARPATLRVDPA